MILRDDFWTIGLEDEPCDTCNARPSKHAGHGSFTCKKCYDASWCPKCHYRLYDNHVCPTPEERIQRERTAKSIELADFSKVREIETLLEERDVFLALLRGIEDEQASQNSRCFVCGCDQHEDDCELVAALKR